MPALWPDDKSTLILKNLCIIIIIKNNLMIIWFGYVLHNNYLLLVCSSQVLISTCIVHNHQNQ